MKTLSNNILSIVVLSAFGLSSSQVFAEGGKISGIGTVSYTKQEALPVNEANGN